MGVYYGGYTAKVFFAVMSSGKTERRLREMAEWSENPELLLKAAGTIRKLREKVKRNEQVISYLRGKDEQRI